MKKIFIGLLFVVLLIVGFEGMSSFWAEHTYYQGMLLSWKNWGLILAAGVCGIIPVCYMNSRRISLTKIILGIGGGLSLFMFLHELILGNLLTLFSLVPLVFNTLVLYCLSLLFIFAIFSLGNWISRKLKLFENIRRQETFLTFGIGLIVFLTIIQILSGIQIFYSAISWILFILLLVLAWFEKKHFEPHKESLVGILENMKEAKTTRRVGWIFTLLAIVSFGYYFFNFSHSFIPYSTAWDANHEYMYIPKIVSEYHGILWGNNGPAHTMIGLWHSYIAFFFSIGAPIAAVFNIAKDTIAVNLNALSGIFVLFFGLGALKESLPLFKKKRDEEENTHGAFLIGWSLILMWLTSGMGAFLIFVDNKTDMGVLALSLLAILSGFIFLNHFNIRGAHIEGKQNTKYLLLSAIFFAFAVIAKVTAFIDVVIFALIMIGFCLNTTTLIGIGIMILGFMGIIQPLFTYAFITKELGILIIMAGLVITIVGVIRGLIWKTDAFSKRLKQLIIRGFTTILTILIIKGPWTAVAQITGEGFDMKTFIKNTILAKKSVEEGESRVLLAQATDDLNMSLQSSIDNQVLIENTKDMSYEQCLKENFDEDELNSTKKTAPGNSLNEDVGRYVGFGWREFKKTGFGSTLLKLLFWKNNACFGWDNDGRKLCKNANLILKKDISALEELDKDLDQDGQAHKLIQELVTAKNAGEDLRDYFTAIETYYQEHSIKTTDNSIYIPYRYIVPLNVVFNRSLQNHTSYYTDIGLIWLCVFVLMIGGLIYAICTYDKKRKQLLIITFSTVIGWTIWWAIAGGIVWYGLGLVIRSTFVIASFFQEWNSEKDKGFQQLIRFLTGLLAIYLIIQGILNASRIASQSGSGPFGWYKSNVGERQNITKNLEVKTEKVYNFNAEDIFGLQFGQYQPFIDSVKTRKDEDGVLIAGTYIQYFLDNQKNLILDGMLNWLWEEMSDFNSCRSYQRLKNDHIKYLIIDPNIGTVGRSGDGNETLFHRFFARLSEDEKKIQTHGAITMLIKMAQEGYLQLMYTNNIGAKYAFELTDSEIMNKFGMMSKDDIILFRAKMSVIKFFYTEEETLQKMFELFQERIVNGKGVGDIASILGKNVDENKLLSVIQNVLNRGNPADIEKLSQDERLVVSQYAGLYRLLTTPGQTEQAQSVLSQLFQNSLFGSSQVIGIQLK